MRLVFFENNDPSQGVVYDAPTPIIKNSFLDEELDNTAIELVEIDRAEPFAPFTICEMQPPNESPIYWTVASDTSAKDIATGRYTHTVQLVEPTKWLERWMVGNKAVTQPLFNYFEEPAGVVQPNRELDAEFQEILGIELTTATLLTLNTEAENETEEVTPYITPVQVGASIPIYLPYAFTQFTSMIDTAGSLFGAEYYYIIQNGTMKEFGEFGTRDYGKRIILKNFLPETGQVRIVYAITSGEAFDSRIYYAQYEFNVAYDAQSISYETAAANMITAAQNLLENEARIFELDVETLPTGNCPEMTVTNATLREALDEIGKTFGAISRLDIEKSGGAFHFVIRFEKFCKDETATLPKFPGEVVTSQSCEDYCTALDTTVDNLVRYSDGGTIADPAVDAFRTLRSEDASYRVTESSGEIFTAFPIERLDHLYVDISAIDKSKTKAEDIAKYCFETSEYSMLSSYLASYPYSKAYALEYSIGSRGIRGLSFEMEDAVSQLFQKPAIVNIINKVFGTNFSDLKNLDFTKILFRVEYVPTGTARLRMRKPWSLGKTESVLPFNQSAAKLDSVAFGRAMFGNVIRMGNAQTAYTFTLPLGYVLPERGQRVGADGYIAEVKTEYGAASKKVTIVVVQGFNRLSAFVGVNQSLRLFEISERTSLDRYIIVEDYCVIGKSPKSGRASAATNALASVLAAPFSNSTPAPRLVARAQGYVEWARDQEESKIIALTPVLLPCLSYAVGNSLVFTFAFGDNFTAGRRIDPLDYAVGAEKEMFKTETDVPYADAFGRIDYLDVAFLDGTGAGSIEGVGETEDKREADRVRKVLSAANALPAIDNDLTYRRNTFVSFFKGRNAIVVNKDSREALKGVTYQLNFAEADGIKVSPGFAESSAFGTPGQGMLLVAINKNINNLTQRIPAGEAVHTIGGTVSEITPQGFAVSFNVPEWFENKTAWAVIDSDFRFCFGANEPLKSGPFKIYFSLIH